jgi:hypothetical protein
MVKWKMESEGILRPSGAEARVNSARGSSAENKEGTVLAIQGDRKAVL